MTIEWEESMRIILPEEVKEILGVINDCGSDAYIVGGCVRDFLLGVPPRDWDITTSAPVDELISEFEKRGYQVIPTGIKHGTITIVINGSGYEVTTFRRESTYSDGRHPDKVEFISNLEEDLGRRDFTINAMAYNENVGLVDPFNGKNDLQDKCIKCVGNPIERFSEDALRILRALRFSGRFDFSIEESTQDAMLKCSSKLRNVSQERIQYEFVKIIGSKILYPEIFKKIVSEFIPEIIPMFSCEQNNPYHIYDVWNHTMVALDYSRRYHPIVQLAVFLHDIGKPQCKTTDANSIDHFYRHAVASADIADGVMRRMKFDNETRESVTQLVRYHDATILNDKKSVKRWLNKIGQTEFLRLLDVRACDIYAHNIKYRQTRIEQVGQIYDLAVEISKSGEAFNIKDLAINGRDIIDLGFSQGPIIGEKLNFLLDMVIEGKVKNEREALINMAKSEC